MLPALLHPKYVFGYRSQVTDNLSFANEHTLVYLAGAVGVTYNLEQNTQRFIANVGHLREVHILHTSPNHQYLAIGERIDAKLHIGVAIYDLVSLKKCNVLVASKLQQQLQQQKQMIVDGVPSPLKFVSLSFSHDCKYIVGQTNESEWTLIYWELESNKIITTLSLSSHRGIGPIHQLAFHPHDPTQISVIGSRGWLLLHLEEGTNHLKMTEELLLHQDDGNYWCHAWVSDTRILVGCDHGKLHLIEGCQVQHHFNIIKVNTDNMSFPTFDTQDWKNDLPLEQNAVNKLAVFTKGFVCSCNSDNAYLFERYAGGKIYRQASVIKIPVDESLAQNSEFEEAHKIVALAVSPSEDMMAVATNMRRIYTFTITNIDINKSLDPTFEVLTPYFHCGHIRDIDVCLRKPIAVTCSSERTIAVWNYVTYQQQLFRYLDEDIFSVALHPTGLYLLVGCTTRLRLMGLMIEDFRTIHEFAIKECSACCFSHGGHLIAALQGCIIMIYSTVTFETVTSLKGHAGKVTSIGWSYNDLKVISCSTDGCIYEWDVLSSKRINEVSIKSCCCSSHDVARDNFTIYVTGSDCTVREIAESQVLGEVTLPGTALTSVTALHCGKALFTSSIHGIIWIVPVPITNQDDWQEFQPISVDVVKMKLTYDDKWLLTVSNDGTLGIWKVTDKDGRLLQSDEELPFLEEILITRADLEEKNLTINELGQKVRDIKAQSEHQRRAKEAECLEHMKTQADRFHHEISTLESELNATKSEKRRLVDHYETVLKKNVDDHHQLVEALQLDAHQKLVAEYEKYHELSTLNNTLCEEYERKLDKLREEHDAAMNTLISEYEAKLQSSVRQLEMAFRDIEDIKSKCDDVVRVTEEDADQEIMTLKANFEDQLENERQISNNMKTEMGILKKKILGMQKEITNLHGEICNKTSELQKLQSIIKHLQNDVDNLNAEIQDRDDLLLLKEKKIYEMKRTKDEFEKLNFILEFKLRETNDILGPKNRCIQMNEVKLANIKAELQTTKQVNKDLELKNQSLKHKLQVTGVSLLNEQQKERTTAALLKNLKWDLGNSSSVLLDSKKLQHHIMDIFRKYHISSS